MTGIVELHGWRLYLFAIDPPQVHPRSRKSITKIGIGIPNNQSNIHPTFPFSELSIAVLLILPETAATVQAVSWFRLFVNAHRNSRSA